MSTRVFLTIDTEFTIGGAFSQPDRRRPVGARSVRCPTREGAAGLGFVLDTFEDHGLKATFFIETLQTAWFGDGPMGEIAAEIAARGHDAQLHLHPVWTWFDAPAWRARLADARPNDDAHGRSPAELIAWIRRGKAAFARWGLPPPVALRTGNLRADLSVYHAMAACGLSIASNVGRGLFEPDEPALRLDAGIHRIGSVLELPVLSYTERALPGRSRSKCLTVAGASFAETRFLLERAHDAGAPAVVLLTHCHEFARGDPAGELRPNLTSQRRLRALCRYLATARRRFSVDTLGQLARHRPQPAAAAALAVPARLAWPRMLANRLAEIGCPGC
jgi:peptidoglycan/xylan/chitin deacetylase (PgdA/CDA1 family)